jgi:hypothetical protein
LNGTDELPIPVKGCEMLLLLQMALSLVSIARYRKYQMVNCGLMGAFNYAHLHVNWTSCLRAKRWMRPVNHFRKRRLYPR